MSDQSLNYTLNLQDHFRKTMLGAQQETAKLDTGMGKLGKTINRVGGMIASAFAIGKIWEFTKQMVLITAVTQSFNNAILASSFSEAAGRANLQFLNAEVDRLHINLDAAQKGYKTFTGATIGSNLQGIKANKIFSQVSAATTVMGLSAEQTEGSFLALGQMLSKGTVQAEELRGQLAERIPGAFQIGARAMGMTTKELGDAMKEGLINSEDFLVKFGNELEKTFGDKLGNALVSTQSKLNDMANAWQRLQVNIGNSTSGVINSSVNFIADALNRLSKYFESANIMTANFARQGATNFGFWSKAAHEAIGIVTGYNYGLSSIQNQENFQNSTYRKYGKQPKDLQEAYGMKAALYQESIDKDKELSLGKLSDDEAKRYQATIAGALRSVNDNIALLTGGKGIKMGADDKATSAGAIGSPLDVSGARPQNITITINDGLVHELNINSQTIEGGINEAVSLTKKGFLELLNDANQIANR